MPTDRNGKQIDREWFEQKLVDIAEGAKDDTKRLQALALLAKLVLPRLKDNTPLEDEQVKAAREAVQKRATREKKPA